MEKITSFDKACFHCYQVTEQLQLLLTKPLECLESLIGGTSKNVIRLFSKGKLVRLERPELKKIIVDHYILGYSIHTVGLLVLLRSDNDLNVQLSLWIHGYCIAQMTGYLNRRKIKKWKSNVDENIRKLLKK